MPRHATSVTYGASSRKNAPNQSQDLPGKSGTPGSATARGCGEGLWKHVYKPQRLLILRDCTTVTGVIVDVTSGPRTPDGHTHAADGDADGWLKLDPPFASLLDRGNAALKSGNLVFEVVCRYPVSDRSAIEACAGFHNQATIPPVGTHVAVTGSLVRDTQASGISWVEIHPVSTITIR